MAQSATADEEDLDVVRARVLDSLAHLDAQMEELTRLLDNPRRLRATSDVLDRLTDEEIRTLDRIISEAHDESGMKWVALVLLDDDKAQVVSSREPIPSGERSQSYCQMVVGAARPWRVNNTRKNNVVNRWRSTVDYDVGAYMGVPVFAQGECIGALCMFQPEPRKWSDEDEALLKRFAAQVSEELAHLTSQRPPADRPEYDLGLPTKRTRSK